jgi:hypothetical protein
MFLRTLPGFVEGWFVEKTDGESRHNVVTTAVWNDEEVCQNAKKPRVHLRSGALPVCRSCGPALLSCSPFRCLGRLNTGLKSSSPSRKVVRGSDGTYFEGFGTNGSSNDCKRGLR